MALSALATVSEEINQTGRAALYNLPTSARYRRVSNRELTNEYLAYAISSASLYSAVGGCELVMISSLPFLDGYNGQFLQLSAIGAGTRRVDNDLSAQGFDNATTSMLLIGTNRGPETRLSFRNIFLDKWNALIEENLMGSDASAKGDPLLTWEMFPPPSSVGLNSDLTYLHIFQALDVQVHVGPLITYHYDAAIGFYLFLFVDVKKQLRALVAGAEVWVQSGFYHDAIESRLWDKVRLEGIPELNSRLASELAPFSTFPLVDVYYLPGDQTGSVPPIFTGNTTDDVTIVLQRE